MTGEVGVPTAIAASERSAAVARANANRTRRNLVADGAMAVATGATLLIVLAVLAVILIRRHPQRRAAHVVGVPQRGAARRHDGRRNLPGHHRHAGDGHPDDAGAACRSGVATAIYLHEYASPVSPVTRAIRIAVANLAGVPSIVFGLFGLGFFVQFLGARHRQGPLPRREDLRPARADLGRPDHGGADAAGRDRRDGRGAARRPA